MRYYLLRQDAGPDYWRVVFADDVPLDALRSGLPLRERSEGGRVTVASEGDVPSDYLELPCPFVSGAMRHAFDAAGVDTVEYLPVSVVQLYDEGRVLARYWAVNVVGAVACAGPAPGGRGGAARGPETDDRVGSEAPPNFFVDRARTLGLDLFRLAEDRDLIVVSERVAERLRAAGLRGVVLQRPEEYDGHRGRTA